MKLNNKLKKPKIWTLLVNFPALSSIILPESSFPVQLRCYQVQSVGAESSRCPLYRDCLSLTASPCDSVPPSHQLHHHFSVAGDRGSKVHGTDKSGTSHRSYSVVSGAPLCYAKLQIWTCNNRPMVWSETAGWLMLEHLSCVCWCYASSLTHGWETCYSHGQLLPATQNSSSQCKYQRSKYPRTKMRHNEWVVS